MEKLFSYEEKEGVMKAHIPLENGFLPDKYGKYSSKDVRRDGNNILSFPIQIEEVPSAAQSLALVCIDYDSTPVCGFTWIHWIACDIPASTTQIPENASHSGELVFTQGSNSCVSRADETSNEVIQGYIGPCPPDKDHTYTLYVYALDRVLGLPQGFYLNDLHWAMKDHILACAEVNFVSRA